jgi:hypothetical protein
MEILLALQFVCERPLVSNCNTDMYADDSTIHISGENRSDLQTKVQEDLNRIELWCKNKKNVKKNIAHNLNIIFNVNKTIDQIMVIYFEINAQEKKKEKTYKQTIIQAKTES